MKRNQLKSKENQRDRLGAEPRGARRRRKTRQKLLDAALILMSEEGPNGVAINDITEKADVAFGSFYNHFQSKDEIYETLCNEVFDQFGDAIDAQLESLTDYAEKMSVAFRHTVEKARRNPHWAMFLIREGISDKTFSHGLGLRMTRDILEGIETGRFRKGDPQLQVIAIGGAILASLSVQLNMNSKDSDSYHFMNMGELNPDNLGERLAKHVLIDLGLDEEEAEKIAQMPIPETNVENENSDK